MTNAVIFFSMRGRPPVYHQPCYVEGLPPSRWMICGKKADLAAVTVMDRQLAAEIGRPCNHCFDPGGVPWRDPTGTLEAGDWWAENYS